MVTGRMVGGNGRIAMEDMAGTKGSGLGLRVVLYSTHS